MFVEKNREKEQWVFKYIKILGVKYKQLKYLFVILLKLGCASAHTLTCM